ncbi:MAG: MFS transporter [Caulobacteraceae bacterium]|nr:MFS transporter [Caulobacteraceae bacterium]
MLRSQAAAAESQTLPPLKRLAAIVGGSAGNLVEWYDWFAYASFTIYFAKAFFPKGDQTTQWLQAAAVFAVGFLARPVGAWLMGIYADRVGRRAALSLSVAMMCAGSLIVALVPGYRTIGVWAPATLTIARLIQGLSVGGEYGASATYLSEMAGRGRRGFWSSFQFVTLIAGQLCALLVLIVLQHLLSTAALETWGWRIPFVIGAGLAVVVFWIQLGLEETSSFAAARERDGERSKTMLLFLEHPKETAIIFALTSAGSLAFYAFTTYMQKFLTNTAHFSKAEATEITAWSLVWYMLCQPACGWLGDILGRRGVLAAGFGLLGLATWPILTALSAQASPFLAFLLIAAALTMISGYTAMSAVVKAELFPAEIRALGVALPYAMANAVFGGTAEYVALWFKQAGIESGFYIYVSAGCLIAFVVAARMRETQTTSRILED